MFVLTVPETDSCHCRHPSWFLDGRSEEHCPKGQWARISSLRADRIRRWNCINHLSAQASWGANVIGFSASVCLGISLDRMAADFVQM